MRNGVTQAISERQSLQRPEWRTKWLPYQDSIIQLLDEGVDEEDGRIRSLRERASADSLAYNVSRWNWKAEMPFLCRARKNTPETRFSAEPASCEAPRPR